MENSMVKVFENGEFGKVRTVVVNGKVMFVARDVAVILGYSNPVEAIGDHCRGVAKCYIPHPQCAEQTVEVNIIPEGDVFRLIASSKLPSAQRFESWVFDEVLPSIRATGGYSLYQGKSPEEIEQAVIRRLSIAPRKDACNALDEARHVSEKPKPLRGYCYGNFTNAIYRALFSMKASEIKALLHVGKKHSLRDKLTAFELETVVKAEQKADELLRGTDGDRLTDAQLQRILEVLFPKIDIVHNHTLPEVCP